MSTLHFHPKAETVDPVLFAAPALSVRRSEGRVLLAPSDPVNQFFAFPQNPLTGPFPHSKPEGPS
ncbi:protein of unknown function [Magnetospirillum sp. XM-1]|nr:protein of unknown function [Magnetospirillum sp. XM-1]